MSCTRAFEVDLPSFLANPSDAQWTPFRAHYPACRECASEVRAWTELDLLLRSGELGRDASHPSAEQLLGFEEHPQSLPSAHRAAIEAHLVQCRSCADELGALRAFDFTRLQAPPTERRKWRLPIFDVSVWLRGVLLHPAFAYALVLLMLLPTLARWQRDAPEPPPPTQVALARAPEAPAPPTVGAPSVEPVERRLIEEQVDDQRTENAGSTIATAQGHDSGERPRPVQHEQSAATNDDRLAAREPPPGSRASRPSRAAARGKDALPTRRDASEVAESAPKDSRVASAQRPPGAEPRAKEGAAVDEPQRESVPYEQALVASREGAPPAAVEESRPHASWRNLWGLAPRHSDDTPDVVAFAGRRAADINAQPLLPFTGTALKARGVGPGGVARSSVDHPTDAVAVTLVADRRVDVPSRALESGIALRFPPPTAMGAAPLPPATTIDVRVVDPVGRQAVYIAHSSPTGGDHLEVQVPAAAMIPGVYRLEISPPDAQVREAVQVYELIVGHP